MENLGFRGKKSKTGIGTNIELSNNLHSSVITCIFI